jgi:XisI protein
MERVAHYRRVLCQLINEEALHRPATGEIEVIPVCDERHDQYQVLYMGWDRGSRVFTVLCHLRLREGKIWIERDGTAEGLALQLLEAGIPEEHIVLAFHPSWKRSCTAFALA